MEIEHNLAIEWSRDYLKARNNISLVIQYLDSIRQNKPTIEVTNDSVRLLMEAMKTASEMYLDLNKLPQYNMELRAENHILRVENKRLQKELEKL